MDFNNLLQCLVNRFMDFKQPPFKITSIIPGQKHIQLQFEIVEILSRNSSGLLCRVVDDTGIVTAFFDKYSQKLQKNSVYQMTNLKTKVVNNHIQLHMSKSTVVSKEPSSLGFRDKSNDVSRRFYVQQNDEITIKPQQKEMIVDDAKKAELLIPSSREEAMEEIRLKKEFYQQTKRSAKTQTKKNQPNQLKYKEKQKQKTLKYKEKVLDQAPSFVRKETPKKQPPKYKQKLTQKKENKTQPKSKSFMKFMEKSQKFTEDSQKEKSQHSQLQQTKKIAKEEIKETEKQEDKEQYGQCIPLIKAYEKVNEHVNVKVWVSTNIRNKKQHQYDCLIADKTGSLWARFSTDISIESNNWYQIDNLQVVKENEQILLKSTDISEAKINFQDGNSYVFKQVKK